MKETSLRAYLFPVPCKILAAIAVSPSGIAVACETERKRCHIVFLARKSHTASQGRPRRDRRSAAVPRAAFRPDGAPQPQLAWFCPEEIIASEAIRIGANFNHRPLLQELLNIQMLQSDSNS
jgi:hypothetical protein